MIHQKFGHDPSLCVPLSTSPNYYYWKFEIIFIIFKNLFWISKDQTRIQNIIDMDQYGCRVVVMSSITSQLKSACRRRTIFIMFCDVLASMNDVTNVYFLIYKIKFYFVTHHHTPHKPVHQMAWPSKTCTFWPFWHCANCEKRVKTAE